MVFQILSVAVGFIGLLVLLYTLKWLLKGTWIVGFLKGMLGVALLSLVAVTGLSAWDVFTYHEIDSSEVLATLTFEKQAHQKYQVTVVMTSGEEQSYELSGDQWQMDARIWLWGKGLEKVGVKPGYRLDRIVGRYLSLEQERHSPRTVYNLGPEESKVDVWKLFNQYAANNKILMAKYGSATFMPMVDGGLFEVSLSSTGLVGRPLNESALRATDSWQIDSSPSQ